MTLQDLKTALEAKTFYRFRFDKSNLGMDRLSLLGLQELAYIQIFTNGNLLRVSATRKPSNQNSLDEWKSHDVWCKTVTEVIKWLNTLTGDTDYGYKEGTC